VIDEKAWQVNKSREPDHHEDDMKSFHPEPDKHRYGLEKLPRLIGSVSVFQGIRRDGKSQDSIWKQLI